MTNIGLTQLGYVGFTSPKTSSWREFGEILGGEIVEMPEAAFGIRLDSDRTARIVVHEGELEALAYAGWEVAGPSELSELFDRLVVAGASPERRQDLARVRKVQELVTFTDPDGIPGELFWGAASAMRTRFHSPHGVEFVAGETGMGHLTLAVVDFTRTREFYTNVLGMKLTEIADVGPTVVGFLRCNPRHHSLAIAQHPKGSALAHLSVEVEHLDALGAIRDRLLDSGFEIERDLGRHPTDDVISFYALVNGGFEIEIGWGSCSVDDETWETDRYNRSGWSWGHRQVKNPAAVLGS